ncbi:hypothetical protein LINGRAHAP2_LOCUS24205, partial [Linum grandiflorum]
MVVILTQSGSPAKMTLVQPAVLCFYLKMQQSRGNQ